MRRLSIQGEGLVYREKVWYTRRRRRFGIQGEGLVYKEKVRYTRRRFGIQEEE